MIETIVRVAKEELPPRSADAVVEKMAEKGWKPAVAEAKRRFLDVVGLEEANFQAFGINPYGRRYSGVVNGDVFFRDGDIFYLITNVVGDTARHLDPYYARQREKADPEIEIGIISSEPSNATKRLEEFAENLTSCISNSLDGRKVRHMSFEWSEANSDGSGIDRIMAMANEQSDVSFSKAKLDDDEVEAALILSDKGARTTLIDMGRAGFARESDIFGTRKGGQAKREVLHSLVENGMLQEEYLLECKRTNAPLTRLESPDQLQTDSIGNLPCGTCGSLFKDENVAKGFAVTELGRKLANASHWMTIWLTRQLVDVGIGIDSIWWNLEESSEEVDILVEILGQLWIFELKDREFGAGDAYPLNYRQARYRANKSFVVTTEKVSRDAKRVFEEALRQSRSNREKPVYVEGLEEATLKLKDAVTIASLQYANYRLRPLTRVSGFDFGQVLAHRFDVDSSTIGVSDELPF
jgi:hypothetical protein